jgi:protein-S-isoprenylcysteine O-methyltransferase Ste14
LAFNSISVITLIPLLVYSSALKGDPLFAWQGVWRLIQIPLASVAILLFITGGRRYDFLQFIGFRQTKTKTDCQALTDNCQVETSGVLGLIRHPWYTGGILIVWVRALDLSVILANLVISTYFIIGAYLEEQKLRRQFGQGYADYQNQVSMFLPFKWIGQRWRILNAWRNSR